MTWRYKLRGLFRRDRLEREMAEEMRFHLKQRTTENMADGMAPEEASAAARRRFGGVEQIKERCRDQHRWVWLEQAAQDVRFACRQLGRAKGFTAVVGFTLALGIGATTAVYSVVDGVVLHPVQAERPIAWYRSASIFTSATAKRRVRRACHRRSSRP